MARRKSSKFDKVQTRIKDIQENVGGDYITLTEDDIYEALIVGVVYREDVVSVYDGVEKIQDKISYLFAVPTDDGVATLQREYTVSAYEQAKINELLTKFDIELEDFYTIVGDTVRIAVSIKTSKKGKDYPNIDKILLKKKNADDIELDDDLVLPSWYGEDAKENLIDLIEGVTIKEEDKKKKRKKVKAVPDDEVEEEVIEEDDFFDELKEDEDDDE